MFVDALKIAREWLLESPVATLTAGNLAGGVYCGDLPKAFDPSIAPGVQIQYSGGRMGDEMIGETFARLMYKVYAPIASQLSAYQVYGAIMNAIHGANMVDFGADGIVVCCTAESLPQDSTDPDSGWVVCYGFFELHLLPAPPEFVPSYLLLENGNGILLEDGSGSLEMEQN